MLLHRWKYLVVVGIALLAACKEKGEIPVSTDYSSIIGVWLSLDSVLVQDSSGWNYINDTLIISVDPVPEKGYNYDYVFATEGSRPAFYKMKFYDKDQLDLVYMGPTFIYLTETFTHTITLSANQQILEIDNLKASYPASFFNVFKKIE